ncbi:HAD family hydrolase [Sulfitobacter sp. LCG007]
MSALDGIVFDKDGTLFDFRATWSAWAQALLRELSQGDQARASRMGAAIGFDTANASFAPDSIVIAGTVEEVGAALGPQVPGMSRDALIDFINAEAMRAPQVEAAPLVPLLTGLRDRGLRLGVATNDSEVPARVHLDAAGVTPLFDFIAGYDSGHGAKPGPGPLLAFAAACGLLPGRVAMVGDSAHDLTAGRAAGMICVAVLTGIARRAELEPLADVVLGDISELAGWIDSLS